MSLPNSADLSHRDRFRFPLDLVAAVAARLLKGESYQDAARRALKLLEACDEELTSNAEANDPVACMLAALGGNGANSAEAGKIEAGKKADQQPEPASPQVRGSEDRPSLAVTKASAAPPYSGLPASMPFQRMLKHVTGKDGAKARKDYADFLRWHMRAEKAPPSGCFVAADKNPDGSMRPLEERQAEEETWWLAEVAKVPEPAEHEVDARIREEAGRTSLRSRAEVERWAERFNTWKKRETSKAAAAKGRQGGRGKKKG